MTENPTPPVVVSPLPRLPMSKALRTLIADATGKPCELRRIPQTPKLGPDGEPVLTDGSPTLTPVGAPFTILWPREAVYGGPGLYDAHERVVWTYQAQIAALRGDQAEVFRDKVVRGIVGLTADGSFAYPLEVPGIAVMARTLGVENSDQGGAELSSLVSVDVLFDIHATPARSAFAGLLD
jgi:hypothetical protein